MDSQSSQNTSSDSTDINNSKSIIRQKIIQIIQNIKISKIKNFKHQHEPLILTQQLLNKYQLPPTRSSYNIRPFNFHELQEKLETITSKYLYASRQINPDHIDDKRKSKIQKKTKLSKNINLLFKNIIQNQIINLDKSKLKLKVFQQIKLKLCRLKKKLKDYYSNARNQDSGLQKHIQSAISQMLQINNIKTQSEQQDKSYANSNSEGASPIRSLSSRSEVSSQQLLGGLSYRSRIRQMPQSQNTPKEAFSMAAKYKNLQSGNKKLNSEMKRRPT